MVEKALLTYTKVLGRADLSSDGLIPESPEQLQRAGKGGIVLGFEEENAPQQSQNWHRKGSCTPSGRRASLCLSRLPRAETAALNRLLLQKIGQEEIC